MQTGFLTLDGKTYYLQENGKMLTKAKTFTPDARTAFFIKDRRTRLLSTTAKTGKQREAVNATSIYRFPLYLTYLTDSYGAACP